jgi:hypothetical protein
MKEAELEKLLNYAFPNFQAFSSFLGKQTRAFIICTS